MRDGTRQIITLMHNWAGYLQGVQVGIADYCLQRPNWICVPVHPVPGPLPALADRKPDGVIAYVERRYVRQLKQLRVPVVDVSNWLPGTHFPSVLADDRAAGRMAARYLLDLGLRHFAVAEMGGALFSTLRLGGFTQALRAEGFTATLLGSGPHAVRPKAAIPPGLNPRVFCQLRELPKPLGVFAASDVVAALVLETCRHAGVRVPEDVCVLGVDNDELVTRVTHPPLSSIVLPSRKIGFEAARLLDRLMAGRRPPRHPVLLPPVGVESRQSTNLLAVADEDVRAAVRHIREQTHAQLTVGDLLKVVPVGRRRLERKFMTHLGRSPLQEIRRARLEKAKELLAATELSVAAVAGRCGFSSPERLANVFRVATGATPSAYRRRFRLKA